LWDLEAAALDNTWLISVTISGDFLCGVYYRSAGKAKRIPATT